MDAETVAKIDSLVQGLKDLKLQTTALIITTEALTDKVDSLNTKCDGLQQDLKATNAAMRHMLRKAHNSQIGLNDPLLPVPREDGRPLPPLIEYPPTISALVVAGSETTPGQRKTSGWNKEKSKALLDVLEDGASDGDTCNDETTSRRRRRRVLKHMGVTMAQVAFAAQLAATA